MNNFPACLTVLNAENGDSVKLFMCGLLPFFTYILLLYRYKKLVYQKVVRQLMLYAWGAMATTSFDPMCRKGVDPTSDFTGGLVVSGTTAVFDS